MILTTGKVILYKAPVALIVALPLLHVLLWVAARDKVFCRIQASSSCFKIFNNREEYTLSPVTTHTSLSKLANMALARFKAYGVLSSGGV